jgi:hypothetical protein
MIGSGIPISQSNTPFPERHGSLHWTSNSLGFHWFHCRTVQAVANPLTAHHREPTGASFEAPGRFSRSGVQYNRDDRQRVCSAPTLTTDFAKVVKAASVAFSSFSVASRSATASCRVLRPTCEACRSETSRNARRPAPQREGRRRARAFPCSLS